MDQGEEQRRSGNRSRCYVSTPDIDTVKTGWLLGLDNTSLTLFIGFITGYCQIKSLTRIWNRSEVYYWRVCCYEEELESIEHLLPNCPALSWLLLKTLGTGFIEGLNSVSRVVIKALHKFIPSLRWLRSAITSIA